MPADIRLPTYFSTCSAKKHGIVHHFVCMHMHHDLACTVGEFEGAGGFIGARGNR